MVNIKEALNRARGKRQATPRGRAIMEVHAIDEKANTVTGKLLMGSGAGEVITVRLNKDVDERQLDASSLIKGRAKVELPKGEKPGGTLQLEGISRKEGSEVYDVRWAKTFQARPSDDQQLHVDKVFRLNVISGWGGGKRWAAIGVVDLENEVHARTAEEMKAAMIEAFDRKGGVTIAAITEDGEPIEVSYYCRNIREGDRYVRQTGESRFAEFEGNLGEDLEAVFGETLARSGISVVPIQSIRVGNDTWAAVEEKLAERGRGGPVDPAMFAVTGLAGRFAGAWARLESEADQEAVRKAFLDFANSDAQAKFHARGFAAVDDRDIEAFLEAKGVELIKLPNPGRDGLPAMGYITGAFLTLPYDRDNPESDVMVTKTFATTAAAPFPPFKAFEAIRAAYYEEMPKAVHAIAAAELSSGRTVSAPEKAEKAAATPAAEKKAAAKDAPAEPFHDDLDDVLSDIEDVIDLN